MVGVLDVELVGMQKENGGRVAEVMPIGGWGNLGVLRMVDEGCGVLGGDEDEVLSDLNLTTFLSI